MNKQCKCVLWFHDWNKWEIVAEGNIIKREDWAWDKERIAGTYITQQRTCRKCNKTQQKLTQIRI